MRLVLPKSKKNRKGKYKKLKLQIHVGLMNLGTKILETKMSKLNLTIYKKNYTSRPSGIYSKYARLV